MIQGLLLALALLLAPPAAAAPYMLWFPTSDDHATDGDEWGCFIVQLASTNDSQFRCRVPPGYTLIISSMGAGVTDATSLQDIGIVFHNGTSRVSASQIDAGDGNAETCSAGNLGGDGELDAQFEWCRQDFVEILTAGTQYWVEAISLGAGGNDLKDLSVQVIGVLVESTERRGEIRSEFMWVNHYADGSVSVGDGGGPCAPRETSFNNWVCITTVAMRITSLGIGANTLTSANECGSITIKHNGTNVSKMAVQYGDGIATTGECRLDDSDLDAAGEACVVYDNVQLAAGDYFQYVHATAPGCGAGPAAWLSGSVSIGAMIP